MPRHARLILIGSDPTNDTASLLNSRPWLSRRRWFIIYNRTALAVVQSQVYINALALTIASYSNMSYAVWQQVCFVFFFFLLAWQAACFRLIQLKKKDKSISVSINQYGMLVIELKMVTRLLLYKEIKNNNCAGLKKFFLSILG